MVIHTTALSIDDNPIVGVNNDDFLEKINELNKNNDGLMELINSRLTIEDIYLEVK